MDKKKIIMIAVPVLLVGGFLGKGALLGAPKKAAASTGAAAVAAKPSPMAGAILRLDPITVNLTDGHYLRLGLALQLTTKGDAKSLDGSKALDAAITTLSGRTLAQTLSAKGRDTARTELTTKLEAAYPDQVMGLYFTDYVTQ